MTKEQIDKLIKVGERKGFNAVQLAQHAVCIGHSAADATLVMRAFDRKHPPVRPDFVRIVKESVSPAMNLEANPVVSAKRSVRAWKKMLKPGKFPNNVTSEIRTPPGSEDALSGYVPSKLNRSAVKNYAMLVSVSKRAGKFRRVSKGFVVGVEAEVDAALRAIGGNPNTESADIPGTWDFLNRKQIRPKVEEQMNLLIKKTIFARVMRHPSMGKTLK